MTDPETRVVEASRRLYAAKIAHASSETEAEVKARWLELADAQREWARAMRKVTGQHATYRMEDGRHEGGGL